MTDVVSSEINIRETVGNWGYFALVMFVIMQFANSVGVSPIPHFLLPEVFPFK